MKLSHITYQLALLASVLSLVFAVSAQAEAVPRVDARSALLIDQDTGQVLYELNANKRLPIASLTKLMTALLVLEHGALDQRLAAVDYQAQAAESQLGLRPGEAVSVRDLMQALLLASANDAAATLAQGVAGSTTAFVKQMNKRARQLRLNNTHFANPVGLDQPGHFSSAMDLARLARKLMRNRFFRATVASRQQQLTTGDHPRTVQNRNDLVGRYKFVKGVKTGHTVQAGYSLVGAATRNGLHLISVELGAPTQAARDTDTLNLFEYGFAHFTVLRPVLRGHPYGQAKVRFHAGEVKLLAGKTIAVAVRRGGKLQLRTTSRNEVKATRAGEVLGRATAYLGGQPVSSSNLKAARTVTKAGVFLIVFYYLTRPLTLLFLIAMIAVVLVYMRKVLVSNRNKQRR